MTHVDPDAIAPLYTTDRAEITKDMDIFHVSYSTIEQYKVIAFSRMNRYIIVIDKNNNETKYKFTDEHRMEFYSTLQLARQARYDAEMIRLNAKKNGIAMQINEIEEMEKRLAKEHDELNADKYLEQVVLGSETK